MLLEINDRRTVIKWGPVGFMSYNTGSRLWGFTTVWCELFDIELTLLHSSSIHRHS